MSYGKQDTHLGRIAGFGATSSQSMGNASRRQSGPRKGSPSWANNFEPNEGLPDLGRLIPGKYENERIDPVTGQVLVEECGWLEYTEHYHGGVKKSMICSGGIHRMNDRKLAKPCRGCDIWREDYEERKRIESQIGQKPTQPNRMSFSSKYAFNILLLGEPTLGGYFFKGYQYDKDGRVAVSRQGNQPFMEFIKYEGPNQPEYQHILRDLTALGKQIEWRIGHVQAFPMNYGMFKALETYSEILQRHCKSCGGQNCIQTQGYVCPHCGCPSVQDVSLPADKVKELVSQPLDCRNCRQRAYPFAIQACQYCQKGQSASIWDVDFQFAISRSKQTKQLMIPWSSAPKGIEPQYAEVLKKLPDLKAKFAITPYEEQVQLFGHPGAAPQQPQGGPPGAAAPAPVHYNPAQYAGGYSHYQQPGAPPAPAGYQQPPAQNYTYQPGAAPAAPAQPYDPSQPPGWYRG